MKRQKRMIVIVIMMVCMMSGLLVMEATDVQAAVKLNKKSVSLYVDDTVQLKLNGAKTLSWKSSNKQVATVTKNGLVKGIEEGSCVITTKDKKTKKSYTCKVNVKALQSLGLTKDDIWAFTGGTVIAYNSEKVKGAEYYLDGQRIQIEKDTVWRRRNQQDEIYTCIQLNEKLSDGEHSFEIRKKGYVPLVTTFTFESLKVDGMFAKDPWASNGWLFIYGNAELEGKEYKVALNGKEVTPKKQFLNGDGYYMIWVNVSDLPAGEYALTVTSDGFPDGTATLQL